LQAQWGDVTTNDPIWIHKIMHMDSTYRESSTTITKQKLATAVEERMMAYVFIKNADQARYGSLFRYLNEQKALGNDQFPKTVMAAVQAISNRPLDNRNKKKDSGKLDKSYSGKSDEKVDLSFNQSKSNITCYCCGENSHTAYKCPIKNDIPPKNWFKNTKRKPGQSHINTDSQVVPAAATAVHMGNSDTSSVSSGSNTGCTVGWNGAHIAHSFFENMNGPLRDWILLDSQSTTSIFCNPRYVTNICKVPTTLYLDTNGGQLATNLIATVPNYGDVWFHPKAITNIFSLSEAMAQYPFQFDSMKEPAFIVHTNGKTTRFVQHESGLFVFKPQLDTGSAGVNCVTTVEENKTLFTAREFEQAKAARNLYHALGTPSLADLKKIIQMNAIQDNPVTLKQVKLAEKIFGPDVGALKGKTVRKKPAPVAPDYIQIPRELTMNHHEVTLCMDGMNVNGLWFLTTVSRKIMYRTVEQITHQTLECYIQALDNVIRIYNAAGFQITHLLCDNQFAPIRAQLEDQYRFRVNLSNP